MSQSDLETKLRRRARDLIDRHLLPGEPVVFLWGAYGIGSCCALCEQPIKEAEVEYNLETPFGGARRHFRFHFLCHALWQLECADSLGPRWME